MHNLHNKYFLGKKIMWVEDDELLGSLIVKKISEKGCILVYIPTGEQAVEVVEKEMPDLLLLDILLPGISGIDVLEKIKSNPKLKDIPVVIFSNLDDQASIDRCLALGAAAYYVKTSMTLDEITEKIEFILKHNIKPE
jgi:CheY-like chemotaxis protein